MFLAGKKSRVLNSKIANNVVCPKCNARNSTLISILGFYKHVLQIPFLSAGKTGVSNCQKCNTSFKLKEMPNLIKLAYFELKEITKTPVWFYLGLIVIKTLVLVKIFSKYF